MLRIYKWGALALAGLIGLSSCKKDPEVDLTSPIPAITAVNISPSSVVEFQDSIIFTISYRDGDGDLGENTPDVDNLFVVDNRIGTREGFRIPQLSPDGSNIAISGDLRVVLPNTGITDNSSEQRFTFTIYVKDRAGNESNHMDSPEITVRK